MLSNYLMRLVILKPGNDTSTRIWIDTGEPTLRRAKTEAGRFYEDDEEGEIILATADNPDRLVSTKTNRPGYQWVDRKN